MCGLRETAAAVTVVALGLSFLKHSSARLAAALAAFLAAFLTLLAFLADIALYGWVKQQVHKLDGIESDTATGPGEFILPLQFPPYLHSLLHFVFSSLNFPPTRLSLLVIHHDCPDDRGPMTNG